MDRPRRREVPAAETATAAAGTPRRQHRQPARKALGTLAMLLAGLLLSWAAWLVWQTVTLEDPPPYQVTVDKVGPHAAPRVIR